MILFILTPNLKTSFVYFGWQRHGRGYMSCPLTISVIIWVGPKTSDFRRYFINVHVRPFCACCVLYIKDRCIMCYFSV